MSELLRDLRFGARQLLKRPGFTLVAVITLGLGIGATSAVYSVIDALLLSPLPFEQPERLVAVWDSNDGRGWEYSNVSPGDYPDWRTAESLDDLALYYYDSRDLTGRGDPRRLGCLVASANLMPLLGVEPELGRQLTSEEAGPGGGAVALASAAFFRDVLEGDPRALDEPLTLGGQPTTIVGVLPDRLQVPFGEFDLLLPNQRDLATHHRGWRYAFMIGRLAEGRTVEQADAELGAISLSVNEQHPQGKAGWRAKAQPMLASIVGDDLRARLFTISAAVGLVFLIACANVASLLFTRATARQKEIAVRAALGASRPRLVRQLLTEGLLLAALGGVVGLVLSAWALDGLRLLLEGSVPRLHEVSLDARTLVFTCLAALASTLVFALAPALVGSRTSLSAVMNDSMRSSTAGAGARLHRDLIVAGQVALALGLVICAGLMIRSFWKLTQVDPGFRAEGLLTFHVTRPPWSSGDEGTPWDFHDELRTRLEALPGVESVSGTQSLPLASGGAIVFRPQGFEPAVPGEIQYVGHRVCSPGYFSTMGIPILSGRDFEESDNVAEGNSSRLVIIVNETLAERYWPDEDPIGQLVNIAEPREDELDLEVVGVVGDVLHQGLSNPPGPEMFRPFRQSPGSGAVTYVVRSSGEPLDLGDDVRATVRSLGPDQPVFGMRTMASIVEESTQASAVYATLLSVLAGLALTLAGVGLYGVMSQSVSQRTGEIGIRMALGADSRAVVRLVVSRSVGLTAAGLVVGAAAAIAVASWTPLGDQLYRIPPTDPPTYLVVAGLLLVVAVLASWAPAWRATRIQPMTAMRVD